MKIPVQLLVLPAMCMATLVPPVAIAQQSTGVPGEVVAGRDGNDLGRVFYDAAQRRMLERAMAQEDNGETQSGEPTAAEDIRFNGVMRIRGGQTNAWVNGTVLAPDHQSDSTANASGLNIELLGESLVVRHESGQTVLRAGDSLNQPTGTAPTADAEQ